MWRVRAVIVTLGGMTREVWRRMLRFYAGVRGRRPWAAASSIRRQYVFGAVGRKAFDVAIRQRGRLRRVKGT